MDYCLMATCLWNDYILHGYARTCSVLILPVVTSSRLIINLLLFFYLVPLLQGLDFNSCLCWNHPFVSYSPPYFFTAVIYDVLREKYRKQLAHTHSPIAICTT